MDDQADVRLVVGAMLERLGCFVQTAASSEEARQIFSRPTHGVALALIDVLMPGEDGMSLALHLRQAWPELTIVMLSGRLADETRWVVEEHGLKLLAKPFGLDELRDLVGEVLAGRDLRL